MARTQERTGPQDATGDTPGRSRERTWSNGNPAVVAGVSLLAMAALAGVGYGVFVEGLVTHGDAARTAADIAASEALFRLGIVCLLLVASLDVVVGWALHGVFGHVDPNLSLLTAGFRLVYAGVFVVAASQLSGVLRLLGDGEHALVLRSQELESLALLRIEAFGDVWQAGLVLFGVHLLLLGLLVHRSRFAWKPLAALVALAGAGYVVDGVGAVLSGGAWPEVSLFTFVGEVLLAIWLLTSGRSRFRSTPQARI